VTTGQASLLLRPGRIRKGKAFRRRSFGKLRTFGPFDFSQGFQPNKESPRRRFCFLFDKKKEYIQNQIEQRIQPALWLFYTRGVVNLLLFLRDKQPNKGMSTSRRSLAVSSIREAMKVVSKNNVVLASLFYFLGIWVLEKSFCVILV